MNNKERNSNFELLRIISMFLIIIYHIIYHGKMIDNCQNSAIKLLLELILFFTLVHVNSFVLLTGYFQSTKEFKQSKVWSILNASLFYRLLILLVFALLNIRIATKVEFMKEIFIINTSEYWFIKTYIILYLISPFINIFINKIEKRQYQNLLIVLLMIFSILPYLTGGQIFDNYGMNLYNFIFLYLIGGYLKKFPLEKSYLFCKCSKNKIRFISIIIFFAMMFINFSFYCTSKSFLNINTVTYEICNNIIKMSFLYSNPFVIIQSVSFFYFFKTLSFKSKIINFIAKLTLGIYMIHDHDFVREFLYVFLDVNGKMLGIRSIIYIFVIALGIFVIGSIVEIFRQWIFKFIYNFKMSQKIRDYYYDWIKNF